MGSKSRAWRKLHCHPSIAFLWLPLLTRGLFSELLRYSDEQSRVYVGDEDPVGTLCRLLAAHPGERRAITKHLAALDAAGFARIVDEYLVLRSEV